MESLCGRAEAAEASNEAMASSREKWRTLERNARMRNRTIVALSAISHKREVGSRCEDLAGSAEGAREQARNLRIHNDRIARPPLGPGLATSLISWSFKRPRGAPASHEATREEEVTGAAWSARNGGFDRLSLSSGNVILSLRNPPAEDSELVRVHGLIEVDAHA